MSLLKKEMMTVLGMATLMIAGGGVNSGGSCDDGGDDNDHGR